MTFAVVVWGVMVGGPLLAWLLFRSRGYKRQPVDAPQGPGWQRTGERTVDPTTGELLDVWYRPQDGERAYARSEQRAPGRTGPVMLAALALPAMAQAQDLGRDRLQAFTATDFHRGLRDRALASIPAAVFRRCEGLVSPGSRVTITRPVTFAASGFPNGGAWQEAFPVSGCGNDTTLNLYFVATPDEKVDVVAGLPGATRADLTLQRDALRFATMGATVAARSCNRFDVGNTELRGAEPGADGRKPWHETWTMLGCGRSFAVPLDFIPDQTGTTINQPGGVAER